tara:strand:+ start:715 stop:1194 length:480 start_codon:yes stop_codon:yes gene_type:complete
MDEEGRLKLKNMINEFKPEETTEKIRSLKHSDIIKNQVDVYLNLKKKYSRVSKETFNSMCKKQCAFLFNNYTNLYNKLVKDELDLSILFKFVSILKDIENGKLDQHEGSVKVGQILKELYIDSALREDKKRQKKKHKYRKAKKISWSDFKKSPVNGSKN